MNAPCMNCKKRSHNCHASCAYYQQYREDLRERSDNAIYLKGYDDKGLFCDYGRSFSDTENISIKGTKNFGTF